MNTLIGLAFLCMLIGLYILERLSAILGQLRRIAELLDRK